MSNEATRFGNSGRVAWMFAALALVVYAVTRLVALEQFPIYFFTDEAIHPVHAADLLERGFRDAQGNLLPSYFQNGSFWNLSLSVYWHTLPVSLFGKTIFVTRATSALISLLGSCAVALMLKAVFRVPTWWSAILILGAMPAWFLHSRTAFETVLMVSFYACFLLCYLLYRTRATWYLYPALVFGAMTFYAYANGQAVMALTGILLAFSDFRYHLKHWRVTLPGIAFVLILAAPYLRFRLEHTDEVAHHLRVINSYWLHNIPTSDKLVLLLTRWAYGLSPQYWFLPNTQDLTRHRMNDYGHLALWMLPLGLLGGALSLWRVQSPSHRALWLALIAAPFGSALAEIGITRALAFIVPASAFIALGLDALIAGVRWERARQILTALVFVWLTSWNSFMLGDALSNGATWSTDYGLYGMQWGAKQIFQDWLPNHRAHFPDDRIHISHTWANGTNTLAEFFDLDPAHADLITVHAWLERQRELDDDDLFVMAPAEYMLARQSNKFARVQLEDVIDLPNHTAGFYIARLQYVRDIEAIFAEEHALAQQPVRQEIMLNGETITILHTPFEDGNAQMIFDNDVYTVARGIDGNPFNLEIEFAAPREVRAFGGWFGKVKYQLTVTLFDEHGTPARYQQLFNTLNTPISSPAGVPGEIVFAPAVPRVSKMQIEIEYLDVADTTNIHIFDLFLR